MTIDTTRLYERSICMLPHEIWATIFEFIPPPRRIRLMWSLLCRYPSFAFVFAHAPHLWMDWLFQSGCRHHQLSATSFAISLWRTIHGNGRSIPIAVHARTSAVRITALSCYLPPDTLPFIHSMTLRVSRSQFNYCNLRGFLAGLVNLKNLSLMIRDDYTDFDTTPVPMMAFPIPRSVVVSMSDLTTLELTGLLFDKATVERSYFRSLTTLRILDVRLRPGQKSPTVFELLFAAPFVSELVVRPNWSHRRTPPILYALPEKPLLDAWPSRLHTVELSGDRRDVAPFVNALLERFGAQVVRLRVVLYCQSRRQLDFFDEIPVFTKEISTRSDDMIVDVADHSICSRWTTAAVSNVEWFVQWRTYDLWADYWVRLTACSMQLCAH